MPPLESIEPPLFEVEGDRTVSRDAFDLPPSNSPIHESPTVARSEPRTTIGSARSAWMFGRRPGAPCSDTANTSVPWKESLQDTTRLYSKSGRLSRVITTRSH